MVVYFTCVFNTNDMCIQNPSVLSPIVQDLLLSNNSLLIPGYGQVTTFLGSVYDANFIDLPLDDITNLSKGNSITIQPKT